MGAPRLDQIKQFRYSPTTLLTAASLGFGNSRPVTQTGWMKSCFMLDKAKKDKVIKKHRTHETDTGSPQVQIAILSEEVKELTKHLKTHRKDFSSRRGLVKKVAERRRLLKYLERENEKAYADLIVELGLKK